MFGVRGFFRRAAGGSVTVPRTTLGVKLVSYQQFRIRFHRKIHHTLTSVLLPDFGLLSLSGGIVRATESG